MRHTYQHMNVCNQTHLVHAANKDRILQKINAKFELLLQPMLNIFSDGMISTDDSSHQIHQSKDCTLSSEDRHMYPSLDVYATYMKTAC